MKKLIYRPIDLFKKPIAFLVMALLLDQYSFAQTSDIKTDSIQKKESLKILDSPAVQQPASDPFAFGDFSWLNGTSRKTSAPAFDSKYFTGDVTFDFNYTHSYNHPIDNTVVGSTALAETTNCNFHSWEWAEIFTLITCVEGS